MLGECGAQLDEPLGARRPRRVDGDRALAVQPVGALEILVGVVEDHEGVSAHRRQTGFKGRVQVGDPFPRRSGVGAPGCGAGGVEKYQRLGDLIDDPAGISGIEPEMHVELFMLMTVAFVLVDMGLLMVVVFPYPPFAIAQQVYSGHLVKGHDPGSGAEILNGTVEEGLHRLTDPHDQIGLAESAGIGRAHLVGVGRCRPLEQKPGLAGFAHHPGDEGMDRLEADHDIRGLRAQPKRNQRHAQRSESQCLADEVHGCPPRMLGAVAFQQAAR